MIIRTCLFTASAFLATISAASAHPGHGIDGLHAHGETAVIAVAILASLYVAMRYLGKR